MHLHTNKVSPEQCGARVADDQYPLNSPPKRSSLVLKDPPCP